MFIEILVRLAKIKYIDKGFYLNYSIVSNELLSNDGINEIFYNVNNSSK